VSRLSGRPECGARAAPAVPIPFAEPHAEKDGSPRRGGGAGQVRRGQRLSVGPSARVAAPAFGASSPPLGILHEAPLRRTACLIRSSKCFAAGALS